ncbi:MAG: hypothetical protein WCT14_11975 [Treponemataceae bacterium]
MIDQTTLARVNLNAVLRAVEELPAYDEKTREIAEGKRETVQFIVGGMGKARLTVGGGKIEFLSGGGPSSIILWFPKPESLNAMFAGTGGPIPLKGFTKIGWLKGPFTQLTERLSYYLKPTEKLLADRAYRKANSALSLHVAAYAIAEVGNYDPDGKLNAARMADGGIFVAARGGPELTVIAKGKILSTVKGSDPSVRARMVFSDLEAAGALLRGELSAYAAIGAGKISLGGYTPLIDHMNKVLGLVPRYLS